MAGHLPTIDIPVGRGLRTGASRAYQPDGALTDATNVTYAPGSPALEPARGRRLAGDGLHVARELVGVDWASDITAPATPVDAYRRQIFYLNLTGEVRRLGAPQHPSGTGLTAAESVLTTDGADRLDVVRIGNEAIVLTGGTGAALRRQDGELTTSRHGMPPVRLALHVEARSSGTTPVTATAGSVLWAFFVWYDPVRKVESAVSPDVVWRGKNYVADTPRDADGRLGDGSVPVGHSDILPTDGVWSFELYVHKDLFEAAWLAAGQPAKLHIYIGRTIDASPSIPTYSPPALADFFRNWGGDPTDPQLNEYDVATLLTGTVYTAASDPQLAELGTEPHLRLSLASLRYWEITEIGPSFPVATVSIGTQQVSVARNGPPPRASTGVLFAGSLVTNDLDVPWRIHWSWPNAPHAFPASYWADVEPQSEVLRLVALRQRCGVFARSGVYRLNYLPSTSDLSFTEGKLMDEVTTYGPASSQAVTTFTPGNDTAYVAWCAREGLFVTDFYEIAHWSRYLDWEALLGDIGYAASAILVDDPERYRLILYVPDDQGVPPNRAFFFHYHPAHLDDAGFPSVTGPIPRPGGVRAARLVLCADGTRRVVCISTEGALMYEGLDYIDEASATPTTPLAYSLKTSKRYIAGRSRHFLATLAGMHVTARVTAQATAQVIFGDDEVDAAGALKTPYTFTEPRLVTPGDALQLFDAVSTAEYVEFALSGLAADFRLNGFTLAVEERGHATRRTP